MPITPLCNLSPGQGGTIRQLNTVGAMRRRLLDLGFVPRAAVVCLGQSPAGDPVAYGIRGAVVALRQCDSGVIAVEPWEVANRGPH